MNATMAKIGAVAIAAFFLLLLAIHIARDSYMIFLLLALLVCVLIFFFADRVLPSEEDK
jgi:hypothetical protein